MGGQPQGGGWEARGDNKRKCLQTFLFSYHLWLWKRAQLPSATTKGGPKHVITACQEHNKVTFINIYTCTEPTITTANILQTQAEPHWNIHGRYRTSSFRMTSAYLSEKVLTSVQALNTQYIIHSANTCTIILSFRMKKFYLPHIQGVISLTEVYYRSLARNFKESVGVWCAIIGDDKGWYCLCVSPPKGVITIRLCGDNEMGGKGQFPLQFKGVGDSAWAGEMSKMRSKTLPVECSGHGSSQQTTKKRCRWDKDKHLAMKIIHHTLTSALQGNLTEIMSGCELFTVCSCFSSPVLFW